MAVTWQVAACYVVPSLTEWLLCTSRGLWGALGYTGLRRVGTARKWNTRSTAEARRKGRRVRVRQALGGRRKRGGESAEAWGSAGAARAPGLDILWPVGSNPSRRPQQDTGTSSPHPTQSGARFPGLPIITLPVRHRKRKCPSPHISGRPCVAAAAQRVRRVCSDGLWSWGSSSAPSLPFLGARGVGVERGFGAGVLWGLSFPVELPRGGVLFPVGCPCCGRLLPCAVFPRWDPLPCSGVPAMGSTSLFLCPRRGVPLPVV